MTTMPGIASKPVKPPGPVATFFFGRIFPLIFIVAGGAVLFSGGRDLMRARESADWPKAAGVIVSSAVAENTGGKHGTTYAANIHYSYTVAGIDYVTGKVSFGEHGSNDRSRAQGIVAGYPPGKKVTVHYAPGQPSLAVLEEGVKPEAWIAPAFGLVFFAVGLTMAVFMPRLLRKQTEAAKLTADSDTAGESPDLKNLPATHPKVTVTDLGSETVFSTGSANLVGVILLLVAFGQIAFVTGFLKNGQNSTMVIPFIAVDTVLMAFGALILFGKYKVTVGPDAVSLFAGIRPVGIRREIPRRGTMRVTLEFRGANKNGRPIRAVVIRNGAGAEMVFGAFLEDSRKRFIAGHLAKRLGGASGSAANPFA